MSFFRRIADQLTRSTAELDADELATGVDALGATPVAECAPRRVAEVSGVLRSLTIPPRGDVPALVGELYDGTGALSLVWIGRREIPGIRAGVYLRATGRVCEHKGRSTIFNPSYELIARPPAG